VLGVRPARASSPIQRSIARASLIGNADLRIELFPPHSEDGNHLTVVVVVRQVQPRRLDLAIRVDTKGQKGSCRLAVCLASPLRDPLDLTRKRRLDSEVQSLGVRLLSRQWLVS
jgi:hypothetical protein